MRADANGRADRRKRNEQSKSFFHKSSSKIGGVERDAITSYRNQVEPPRRGPSQSARLGGSTLRPIGLPSNTLNRDALRREHFALQREHAGRGLVDPARERDRALENRFELLLVLNARLRVFVLDNQVGVGHVQLQQFAR